MEFAVTSEDLTIDPEGDGPHDKGKSRPWIFTLHESAGESAVSAERKRRKGENATIKLASVDDKMFLKELEYQDYVRKRNTGVWLQNYAHAQRLDRELSEVYKEETQDLKSSIFSVLDQNASFQDETNHFFTTWSADKERKSPQAKKLSASLQAVADEIEAVKQKRLMEEAKAEEQRQIAKAEAERKIEEAKMRQKLEEQKKMELQKQAEMQHQNAQANLLQNSKGTEHVVTPKGTEAVQQKIEKKSQSASGPNVSSALQWKERCEKARDEHSKMAEGIFKASKLDRLKLEKPIKKAVNQVSCSKQQIMFVGQQMNDHLALQKGKGQEFYSYCLIRIADLIAQQGPGLGSSKQLAFSYAELVSLLTSVHNDLILVLVSSLHSLCPLTVPHYPKDYKPMQNDVKGYACMYAALCQINPTEWFDSRERCWNYLACFLNSIPVNESSATALDSFLQIAGHKAFMFFKRQQLKIQKYIQKYFLPKLVMRKGSEDVDAVMSRIEKYIADQVFMNPPEDSYIPESDTSQHIRC